MMKTCYRTFEWKFSLSNESLSWLLVGIRTVPQSNSLDWSHQLVFLQVSTRILFPEVSANRIIVSCGHLECLERKPTPQFLPCIRIPFRPSFQELCIICRIRENRNSRMVFSCRTKEGDAADVDFFDCIGKCAVWLGNSGSEGI
jgi:hypothetical protein